MSTRRFRLANSGQAEKCPKCENDIEFIVRSEQAKQEQREKDAEIAESFEYDHPGCSTGFLIAKAIREE